MDLKKVIRHCRHSSLSFLLHIRIYRRKRFRLLTLPLKRQFPEQCSSIRPTQPFSRSTIKYYALRKERKCVYTSRELYSLILHFNKWVCRKQSFYRPLRPLLSSHNTVAKNRTRKQKVHHFYALSSRFVTFFLQKFQMDAGIPWAPGIANICAAHGRANNRL